MLSKTHLALGLAIALYFLPHVNNKLLFVPIVLIASLLPDLDSGFSYLGRKKILKPFSWVFKHRGFLHSLTLCVALAFLITFVYPPIALPFFLGYSFHLLADSFTIDGIKPFWPLKAESKGKFRTGGKVEDVLFISLSIVDAILVVITIVTLFS